MARRQARVDRERRARRRSPSRPRTPTRRPRSTRRCSATRSWRRRRRDERVIGITAAMNSGTGLDILQKASCPTATTTWASPSSTPCCSPPAWRSRAPSRWRPSTRPSSSAASTRSCTTSACRTSTWSSPWTAPGWWATTAPPTTAPSTSPTSAACRNMMLMAPARRGAAGAHAAHRARTRRARSALRYPRGEAEGVPLPRRPELLEIGRGELLREGERVAFLGYGYGVPVALGAAERLAEEHGIERHRGRRPLRQAAGRRADRLAGGRARRAGHGGGERAGRRLRRRRWWSTWPTTT